MGLLDDLTKALGGTPAAKVADLVEDLWESRKQVLATVGYVRDHGEELLGVARWVGDHGDELLGVARWVQDNGDDLVRLLAVLPTLMQQASEGMDTAGRAVRAAAGFLTGDGDGVSARDVADLAATALARAESQIQATASAFVRLGEQFDALPLMDRPAAMIRDGARSVGGFAGEMTELARKLAQLGAKVTDAGLDLDGMGEGLVASATALAGLAMPRAASLRPAPSTSPVAPPPAKATAKKSTAKKAAAAKAPAKKTAAKKAPAKTTPAKKAPAKQAPAKKAPAKKTPATKATTTRRRTGN